MIVTNVDKLLDLINKRKKITVEEASKELKASPKQLEKIATYLMEEELILMDYKLKGIDLKCIEKKSKELNLKPQTMPEPKEKEKETPTPKKAADIMSSLIKQITSPALKLEDINQIQSIFTKLVSAAKQDNFYNRAFLNEINQFYELLESKKIILLIKSYKESKNKKLLELANQHYTSFTEMQSRLVQRGYSINQALNSQLKSALAESAK